MQYVHVVELLHLQDNYFACIIIGTQIFWTDVLMYTLAIGLVWWLEYQGRSIHVRNDGLVCRQNIEGDFDREATADHLSTPTYFSSFAASFAFSKVSFIHTGLSGLPFLSTLRAVILSIKSMPCTISPNTV